MADALRPTPQAALVPARRTWSLPLLRELPKLTELTLASAIGGGGGTGGGGSTVFALLFALLSLSACNADRMVEPAPPPMAKAVASISCSGDLARRVVSCDAPAAGAGQVVIGGQGNKVILYATDVAYADLGGGEGDFTFDVQVRNVSAQTLGVNGMTPSGVYVFFEAAPLPDVGNITVEDAMDGTFTASGQAYYAYPGTLMQYDTTAKVPWRFHMTGNVNTFTFNVLVATDVIDQGGVLRWEPVWPYDHRYFMDVAVSSPYDMMLVGALGTTRHVGATGATTIPGIDPANITGIAAVSEGKYYAVNGRSILYFDGKVWSKVYERADWGGLQAIYVVDAANVIAVGWGGRISRLSGGTWSDVDAPTTLSGTFVSVSANASGTLVSAVTGDYGNLEVWTSTAGGPFLLDPAFASAAGNSYAGEIAYDSSGNAILAYQDLNGAGAGLVVRSAAVLDTLVYDPDLRPWGIVPIGLEQIAVGGYDAGDVASYIKYYDYGFVTPGHFATTDAIPSFGGQMVMTDPPNFPNTARFMVVNGDGSVYQWAHNVWSNLHVPGYVQDPDIWGAGNSLWFLDGIGNFSKFVNGVETPLPGMGGLHEIWGLSATSFVGASNDKVFTSDGVSGWTQIPGLGATSPIKDLWAGPSGTIILLTTGNDLTYRWGGTPNSVDLGQEATAVWGCDADQAWIVSTIGTVFRFQSGSISPDPLFSYSPASLKAVTGTSCTDVWVAGDQGEVYHWNGTAWSDRSNPGGPDIRTLASPAPGEVLGLGLLGHGMRIYPDIFFPFWSWEGLDLPIQGNDVSAIWRLDNGEVYAVGPNLMVRGRR